MKQILRIGLLTLLCLIVASSLAMAGRSSKAWIGVYTEAVDEDLAETYSLAVDHGVIIDEVIEDSPAEDAGLKEDDIVIAFDGTKVWDDDDLLDFVAELAPGDKITLTVMRDDSEKKIDVVLGKKSARRSYSYRSGSWDDADIRILPKIPSIPRLPRGGSYSYSYTLDNDDYRGGYIGVTLLDISERLADRLGADGEGVLVDEVEEDSPADDAGLLPGDVIVAIDGEETEDYGDVREIIREMDEGDLAHIEIIRDKKHKEIEVEVGYRKGSRFRSFPGGLSWVHALDLYDFDDDLDIDIDFDFDFDDLDDLDDLEDMEWHFRIDDEDFHSDMRDLKRDLLELQEELKELRDDDD
ncbi:MAG: hypothetical protein DRP45_03500 [Candidatus Zixiibacteriota bacterium]|nr:MAG: hypothetical protein DRP45_03500 [candidate division Zixibacteria bacterium]